MEKVNVALDSEEEVVKMILSVFKGKDGAQNVVNLVVAMTNPKSKIYDKAFDKALRKLRPSWFKPIDK